MTDNCQREIDYIRISVTDRCNLRCSYCMPEEGIASLKHEELLSYEEIAKLCKYFVKLGIGKIKLTGGEPLVRKGISDLIKQIKSIDGITSVTLTTNGVELKQQLPDLIKAGLDGVNISLDTLNPVIYEKITKRDVLQEVLDSIDTALQYEKLKVKINCVPIQGTNEKDIIKIAELAKDSRLIIRFIEMMPIGLGKNFNYYSEYKILEELEKKYGPLETCNQVLGNGPAHYYNINGFKGKIGFISAITHQFCDQCNRVRLTSDGFLKTCLQYSEGSDLKVLLRENVEDSVLEQVIYDTIYNKPISHNFNKDKEQETYEQKQMFRIGG